MRVTDYNRIVDLDADDILLLDSDTKGTRAIKVSDLSKQLNKILINSDTTKMPFATRRMTYRGKNLGNVFLTKQREAIANGSFDDLFIGDYWVTPNGYNWLIVDFNRYLNSPLNAAGDNRLTKNHIVLMADRQVSSDKIHSSGTTNWYATELYTTMQGKIPEVAAFFGATNIVNHQRNSATTGQLTQIDLPTLPMITGSTIGDDKSIYWTFYLNLLPFFAFNSDGTNTILVQTPNTANTGFTYIHSTGRFDSTANTADYLWRPIIAISGE